MSEERLRERGIFTRQSFVISQVSSIARIAIAVQV